MIGECGRGDMFDEDTQERIMVTVIDTVGGYSSTQHVGPIVSYLEKQHIEYERNKLYRRRNKRAFEDTRIVCLFYFFGPHRVLDDDISFLKCLHDKVPIVPIVAKADSATVEELAEQLHLIRARLEAANIQYFDFGEDDINEDWLEQPFDRQAFTTVGMAMAAAGTPAQVAPIRPMVRNVFAVISNPRRYIWGTAREDDPTHSDTVRLHNALFGSLGKLEEKMNEIHEDWVDSRNDSCFSRTRILTTESTLIVVAAGMVFLAVLCSFGAARVYFEPSIFFVEWGEGSLSESVDL